MNYLFGLSRRWARLRAGCVLAASLVASLSCANDDPNGPGSGFLPGDPTRLWIAPDSVAMGVNQAVQFEATLDSSTLSAYRRSRGHGWKGSVVVDVSINPQTLTVAEGSAASFTATAALSNGSTTEPSVTWVATGGTIDATGKYTAGKIPGNFAVSATAANGVADTTAVVVTESVPIVTDISLSPTSASLPVGGTKQFVTVGKANDGTTVAVSPKFAATGGTISSEGVYQAGQTVGTFRVIATDTASNLADTSAVIIDAPPATLQAVVLSPANTSLTVAGTQQFTATGKMSDGSTSSVSVTWSATGGTISSAGSYTAGSVAGSYRVIATQTGGTLADTSTVTITASSPTLQAVVLTPASVTLQSGATQQFGVSGRMSDGSTTTVNATYSATGGTITSSGLYTAGPSAGAFQIIAIQQGGTKADTSSVTVTTPPAGSCARTVNANTLSGLSSALGAALPGDCILVAPGTYSLTSALAINRSGTASSPITIQGAGTGSTVIDVNQTAVNIDASYLLIRGIRFTDFGLSGLWFHGSAYNVLDSIEVDHTQQWALTLKDGSHHNVIKNSSFHDTGMGAHPEWGEAIYISNSGDPGYPLDYTCIYNQILNNHFGPNVRSMAIILSQGADHTTIQNNVIDGTGTGFVPGYQSLIASYGSYGLIDNNTLSYGNPYGITFYSGSRTIAGNVVSNNHIALYNIHNYTGWGPFGIALTVNTDDPAKVTVKCSNVVTNIPASGEAFSVSCVP